MSDGQASIQPAFAAQADHQAADELVALKMIMEGTARTTGEEFFGSLVRHLARAMDVAFAFVTEFAESNTRLRTLAFWERDHLAPNIEFDLPGTPCHVVISGSLCHYPSGIAQSFPEDQGMIAMGVESYLGVPLRDAAGEVLGHLAVFDDKPMPPEPRRLFVFHIFAARAAAELERIRADKLLSDSQRRYRELYEDAPTAYVVTDVEGRLLNVNRRAAELLDRDAAEMLDSRLADHAVPGAAGRPRIEALLRQTAGGLETAGVEVEMRRRDSRPLWVSIWAKPLRDRWGRVKAVRSIWVDVTERVVAQHERARLHQQNQYLQEELRSVHNFEEIIGQSPAFQEVLQQVRHVAPTDSTVLITGETGTGKELIARAIHFASRRQDKPLIKVNCAALPSGLVESELFGHEKGAFTGAIARRIGRFELAEGGSIFLDEIGELPPDVQAKLLRVLQEREFERVGGTHSIKANVRVIAATNRDLHKAVADKSFREDLYYRLNVFPIQLPALRQRREDIPLLAHYFVQRLAVQAGKQIDRIDDATIGRLVAYPWPGNIRELENILERAVILSPPGVLEVPADILVVPGCHSADAAAATAGNAAGDLESVQRQHILGVLEQTGWVIDGPGGAAKVLGLHPNTLRSRMKKLGIVRSQPGGA